MILINAMFVLMFMFILFISIPVGLISPRIAGIWTRFPNCSRLNLFFVHIFLLFFSALVVGTTHVAPNASEIRNLIQQEKLVEARREIVKIQDVNLKEILLDELKSAYEKNRINTISPPVEEKIVAETSSQDESINETTEADPLPVIENDDNLVVAESNPPPEKQPESITQCRALLNQAIQYRRSGEVSLAITTVQICLEDLLFNRQDDSLMYFEAKFLLGNLLFENNQLEEAESNYQKLIELMKKSIYGSELVIAQCQANIGFIAIQYRNYEEAEEYLSEAYTILKNKLPESDPDLFAVKKSLAILDVIFEKKEKQRIEELAYQARVAAKKEYVHQRAQISEREEDYRRSLEEAEQRKATQATRDRSYSWQSKPSAQSSQSQSFKLRRGQQEGQSVYFTPASSSSSSSSNSSSSSSPGYQKGSTVNYTSPDQRGALDPYGTISNITGQPKTQFIDSYTKKDGTFVRGYFRTPGNGK